MVKNLNFFFFVGVRQSEILSPRGYFIGGVGGLFLGAPPKKLGFFGAPPTFGMKNPILGVFYQKRTRLHSENPKITPGPNF